RLGCTASALAWEEEQTQDQKADQEQSDQEGDPEGGPKPQRRTDGRRPRLHRGYSRNSSIALNTSSGRSTGTMWPAPGTISVRASGIAAAKSSAYRAGASASCSPQTTSVGAEMR